MTDTPELYIPRPGSVPWKVLSHLVLNSTRTLTRAEVVAEFGAASSGVDAILGISVARGCLTKTRNSKNELVWMLGMVKTFQLDPYLPPPPEAFQPPGPPAPAGSGKWTPAIKVVEPMPRVASGTPPAAPAANPAAPVTRAEDAATCTVDAQRLSLHHPDGPVEEGPTFPVIDMSQRCVIMPLTLTPDQIKAVITNPSTRFDNLADQHHAIGWLFDVYGVLVEHANQTQQGCLAMKEGA